ncbi:MAG: sn-glycerol-3-phosphate ABC transporter ATP-binding protein UgpC [Devosiaceae bacterium]|nr:sn-glycerol-3-phosphate ABC transporter ATP-binding protein UgpC [Devosiaceae bacterium MH13]
MAGLTLRDVRKSYGPVDVIHGVDLDITEGEFVVFVGPSGCGKSTLLRMIAGLEKITGGTVAIGERVVNEVDPAERGVAMVFQTYALYPHMTVEENMSFGLRMNGHPKADIDKRVSEAAAILQLDQLLKRKPAALSGGQRQRVAIGRAIVRNPDVFLFDEPLSNLDAELRVAMRVEISRLHNDMSGATMIYVTHDQTEAMTLADKIVVLRGGYIEQVGAPLELYDDPDNEFVAGFIGSPRMNFLEGEVVGKDKGVTIKLIKQGDAVITLDVGGAELSVGDGCKVGIRPEHLSREAGTMLTLNVDVAEHLGGESYIYAASAAGETLTIETDEGRQARSGADFTIGVPPERAYLFTADGKRVR